VGRRLAAGGSGPPPRASLVETTLALREEGIPAAPGYIPRVVYRQEMFQRRRAYPGSDFPFSLSEISYEPGLCPVAEEILATAIRLPVSEFFTEKDIDDMIRGIRKVARYYAKG